MHRIVNHRKRVKSSDPTFNAIQELIYQYKKFERKQVKYGGEITLPAFMTWLIAEGWSYDYGD